MNCNRDINREISEQLFLDKQIFCLPEIITFPQQQEIIAEVLKNGEELDVWHSYLVRGLLSPEYQDKMYDLRLDTSLPWRYFDTPIASLVQSLLEPLEGILSVTRIKIFLQKPNQALSEHCDKLEYKNNLLFRNFFKTSQFHDFFKEPLHEEQKCLALKIPISERTDECGKSYLRIDGKKYYLNSQNHLYMFNESKLLHGADSCGYWRGVVFVDGKINLSKLFARNLTQMSLSVNSDV